MRNPNGYGTVYKLSGKRRKPYVAAATVRIGTRRKKDISFLRDALGDELYQTVYDKYTEYFNNRPYVADQERKVVGYYATRREAMEALAEYNKNPYDLDARKSTFAELWALWEQTGYDGLAPNTVASRKSAYKRCAPIWDMSICDIKSLHLQAIIDDAADRSIQTQQNIKTVMKIVFNYAMEHDLIHKDYTQYIKLSHAPEEEDEEEKEGIHKPYTTAEIQMLWDNIDLPGVRIILLMIYTGMRPQEAFIMPSEDVHLDERYMIGGVKTKAGKKRLIPLHEDIVPVVRDLLADGGKYLIKYRDDKPLYYNYFIRKMNTPTMEMLGLDHLPYDCRHTFTTVADRYIDIRMLRRIIGHKLDTLADRVYIHKTAEELIEAVNQLIFIDD